MSKGGAMSRATAAVALWLLMASCGPSFNGRVYDGRGMKFVCGEVPGSWHRIEVTDTLLAFRDQEHEATAALNGRCGKDSEDVPLAALTQHLFLMFTERKITEQRLVSMDGREALRTTLTARLDGVDKTFVTYVLKKDGCVWDFMFISRPETFSTGIVQFDRFVAGFRSQTSSVGSD